MRGLDRPVASGSLHRSHIAGVERAFLLSSLGLSAPNGEYHEKCVVSCLFITEGMSLFLEGRHWQPPPQPRRRPAPVSTLERKGAIILDGGSTMEPAPQLRHLQQITLMATYQSEYLAMRS